MYGPGSNEIKLKLEEIDRDLGYLIELLKSKHLFDKLNLIITSDHGMEYISNKTVIFLDDYIDPSLYSAYGSRACYSIFVNNGNLVKFEFMNLIFNNISLFFLKDLMWT